MDPEDIFKRFFSSPFPEFGPRGFGGGDRDRDVWSRESGDGTGMFSDWHHQMHEQMEEMDRQMREVFRIFHIPDMPSAIRDLPEGSSESRQHSSARDRMLKDKGEATPPPSEAPELPTFSSPYLDHGRVFSEWLKQFYKSPHGSMICPEDKTDTDLDGKSPSGAEIAELFKQEKTESPAKHTAENPFFFSGNSVSIQTVIGADGMVEERRTVRDSSGREETTVTRRMGDKSHTVSTIRDEQGRVVKKETFNNVDKEKLSEFDLQLEGKGTSPDSQSPDPKSSLRTPSLPSGILSDNTRGFFKKFFGF